MPYARALLLSSRPSTWDVDGALEHVLTLLSAPWQLLKLILW